jgi:putative oxidoreductase
MFSHLLALRARLLDRVNKLSWLGPLLMRLTLGLVFIGTGWGKLHNLDNVTQFFAELHIPAPHLNAVLAATTEFVGGLCMVAGLMTRLAALPLAFTMLIAIVTARRGDVDGVIALAGLVELVYLVGFVWIALAGPGPVSLDRLLAGRLGARTPTGIAVAPAAGEPRRVAHG